MGRIHAPAAASIEKCPQHRTRIGAGPIDWLRGPVAFRLTLEGRSPSLRPTLGDEIYGGAAEAIRNAFRYARATRVEVVMRYADEQFRLYVRDDGRGIDPAVLARHGVEGHYGLRGMAERAAFGSKTEV